MPQLQFPAPTARQISFFLPFFSRTSLWVLYYLTEIHPLPLYFASFPLNVPYAFSSFIMESSSVQAFTSKRAHGQQASKEPSDKAYCSLFMTNTIFSFQVMIGSDYCQKTTPTITNSLKETTVHQRLCKVFVLL